MAASDAQGADYEAAHVHTVYEEIASHFSSTRYKPWPIVERFLTGQKDGAVGADVGCGNGKYLAVNRNVFIVGSDRSTNLVTIAKQHKPHGVVVADNLALPHPKGCFDFAISIAVVHHLSTPVRRVEAVRCILELLRPGSAGGQGKGQALIYVWALEQKNSRRGWDEGHEQDVMVPWVMTAKKEKVPKKQKKKGEEPAADTGAEPEKTTEEKTTEEKTTEEKKPEGDKTFLRYYHLYRRGELEQDIAEAGGVVVESGYEKDNWWAIASLSN